jgi:hypothetical protein
VRSFCVSNRSWLLPNARGVLTRVEHTKSTITIDRLGKPQQAEIVSKKPGNRGRKMREVFTTSGYAMLDDGVKLSTANGLVSLGQLSLALLGGEKLLVESLVSETAVRDLIDADIMAGPGSLQIDNASVLRMIANVQSSFDRVNEAAIPRACFSCVPAMMSLLRKKAPSLRCDVDNKIYPSEILVHAEGGSDTQLLSITEFFEDETTMVEVPKDCRAIVIDGLICS